MFVPFGINSILLMAFFSLLLEVKSESLLNKIINRVHSNNCPPLIDGPLLEFASPIQLTESNTTSTFGCTRTIECNVLSSPMESMILWYRNGELIEERAVKDITFAESWNKWGGKITSKLGIGEISHRICIDSYLSADTGDAVQVDWFRCKAQLRCSLSHMIESDSLLILKSGDEEKTKRRKARALGHPGQAPLIQLITSSRMELAGNLIQIMCKSTGNPKPKIHWSILSSAEEGQVDTLRPVEEFPFILKLNNGDLLIDSKVTETASLIFKCRAINKFGEDSATSSLIILDQEN